MTIEKKIAFLVFLVFPILGLASIAFAYSAIARFSVMGAIGLVIAPWIFDF